MSLTLRPLVRLLWLEAARTLGVARPETGAPGDLDSIDAVELAIQEALELDGLEEGEARLAEDWRRWKRPSFLDQLLERRLERAMRAGLERMARLSGHEAPARFPGFEVTRLHAGLPGLPGRARVQEVTDVADLEAGLGLDRLVEALLEEEVGGLPERSGRSRAPRVAALYVRGDEPRDLLGDLPATQRRSIELALESVEGLLLSAPESEEDLSGRLLGGKYRVKTLRGKGSFGNVYEAVDERLGARVAIKVLNRRAARSPRAIEHFLREARLLTSIDHENIVRWITFDSTEDGTHYFVMEFLGGEELEEVLQREGLLAPERAARILLQVLAALRMAHGLEVGSLLHLDLKPENVFVLPALGVEEGERVKVIDFGIGQHVGAAARVAGPVPAEAASSLELGGDATCSVSVSVSRVVLDGDDVSGVRRARGGTLLYASPEQCEHLTGSPDIVALDGRSDLYSFGVMAFRMLTGQFPWAECDRVAQALRNHREVPPRKVRAVRPSVPRKLAAFVDRCLEKDREARWADAQEAHRALDEIVNPRTSAVRVASFAGLAVAAIAIVIWWIRPEAAKPVELIDATGGRAGTIQLALGSPHHRVQPVDWKEGAAPDVSVLTADDTVVPGWRADWNAEGKWVELSVDEQAPPPLGPVTVHLGLETGEDMRHTTSFTLERIGAWAFEARVEGLDGERLLDPRGQVVRVDVASSERALGSILEARLLSDGEVLDRKSPGFRPERTEDTLPLRLDALFNLFPDGGEHMVTVQLVDVTGRDPSAKLELVLAGRPVEIAAAGFARRNGTAGKPEPVEKATGPWSIYPDYLLHVETTDEADVTMRIVPTADFQGGAFRELTLTATPDEPLEVPLTDLGLHLGLSQFTGYLALSASDEAYVQRAEEEPYEDSLPFQFYPEPPSLTLQLASADRPEDSHPLDGGRTVHVPFDGPIVARVQRSQEKRKLIVVARVEDLEGTLLDEGSGSIDVGLDPEASIDLEIPEPGEYVLVLQAYDDMNGHRGQAVGPRGQYPFVADPRPPIVSLAPRGLARDEAGVTAGLVTKDNRPELELELRIEDANPRAKGTLELLGPGGIEIERTDLKELNPRAVNGALVFDLSMQLRGGPELRDGVYSLSVGAYDEAGNRGHSEELRWKRACEDPVVKLRRPLPSDSAAGTPEWPPASFWEIAATVDDPNEVKEVVARLVNEETHKTLELPMSLVRDDLWEVPVADRPEYDALWSETEVRLEVTARDEGGNERTYPLSAVMPFLKLEAKRIALGSGPQLQRILDEKGRQPELVLIEGNERFEYKAGGREEDGAGRNQTWEVPVPRGSIRSFYLGRTEVTRGTFAAFVEAPGGYEEPRWWPAGVEPEAARLDELRSSLPGPEPDEPMTGVTHAEAEACARWLGLRLQSQLEWEYALRGGEAYRVNAFEAGSSASNGHREPAGGAAGTRSAGPWPVGESEDVVTAGTGVGLVGLGTNVCEWTSTPDSFLGQRVSPAQHFKKHVYWYVRPPALVIEEQLDGDGQPDYLAVLPDDDVVEVRLSTRRAGPLHLGDPTTTPRPRRAYLQDADGDGSLDVVVLLADGSGCFFRAADGGFANEPSPLGVPSSPPPVEPPPRFWTVGGSFELANDPSYRALRIQHADESESDLGFRVALDAERARDLLRAEKWRIVE